ncbi:peroxiredoxin-like family protein [Sphingomicrobium sediminis]|uniref:AhpC/TSA family protein n=1 Tax=Sphingomicrobium sediminis TaxID=2950949 RepID=A0A9X2J0J1_9SPHN|nr:peroxiredoxin-like family protein [Sphingomicrobium sediminis]MCM8556328.1 AhpC/TSA family protein [Sphingomicrobium sediminis]
MTRLIPTQTVPDLDLPLIDGGQFSLSGSGADYLTILAFYRGKHCPLCRNWLQELNGLMDDYAERGIKVVAVTMDGQERAQVSRDEWNIDKVPIAYGLSEGQARSYGLYISHKREGSEEPDRFAEPGMFLVHPDRTLYAMTLQTMPFTRPSFKELLGALDFVKDKDYPPRGTVV